MASTVQMPAASCSFVYGAESTLICKKIRNPEKGPLFVVLEENHHHTCPQLQNKNLEKGLVDSALPFSPVNSEQQRTQG